MTKKTHVSYKKAGTIVFMHGEEEPDMLLYLILRARGRYWKLPRGGIEYGESEMEAARRELREETGLTGEDVEFVDGFEAKSEWTMRREGNMNLVHGTYFLAKSRKEEIKLSGEHSKYRWANYLNACGVLSNHDIAVLERAEKFLAERQHTLTPEQFLRRKPTNNV